MADSTLSRTNSSNSIDSIESDVELISRYDIVGERTASVDSPHLGFRDNTITFFSRLKDVISSTEQGTFTPQESDPTSAKSTYHACFIYDNIKVTYSTFP
jgi:hypothetical protein